MSVSSYERLDSLNSETIGGEPRRSSTRSSSKGLWQFILASKWSISLSLAAGIAIEVGVIIFTFWLAQQRTLSCPDWAIDCKVPSRVTWIANHYQSTQGVVGACYSIGLTTQSYLAHSLSESAVWPLVTKQRFSLDKMDDYLALSRGALAAMPSVMKSARTKSTWFVSLIIGLAIICPLASTPLVGYVYEQINQPVQFAGNYTPGGGIGRVYRQTNGSEHLQAEALSLYASWAHGLVNETTLLDTYRDWYVRRDVLAQRGNMTVNAVRVQKNITCQGVQVDYNPDSPYNFRTNMSRRDSDNAAEVQVGTIPKLTVWAHDYGFLSTTRTTATLIFSVLNGEIEGGAWTSIDGWPLVNGTSSIACDVDVEFVDETLRIGDGGISSDSPVTISSVKQIHTADNSDPFGNNKSEVALWFAVAPIICGISVGDRQPLFFNNSVTNLPDLEVTGNKVPAIFTADGIERFIDVAIGAMALGTSSHWSERNDSLTIKSSILQRKMHASRPPMLLILPLLLVLYTGLLAAWNARAHQQRRVPMMRMAGIAEVLKSSQSEEIKALATRDPQFPRQRAAFSERPKMKFGVTPGDVVGLGSHGVRKL
ncbi:hypothetical protein PFICI_04979 [Pestalotiopsis fici W106-1]|uniref:Uncharacterized protein n=1 Tax=Pestalotiopsis fici (strain W106-1 / CGMCC3.15140) TaxID=1229662 RepID=W3XAI0_PESFW|nr:uncharacterized protein PFICI_04979 [Pestalotiopsis fici W106-1]ETS83103.1 hypothetical protein PFICI_04979 [Pestalotiopsis fici W106-1]